VKKGEDRVSTEASTNSFTPSSIAQAVMVKLNSLPLSQQQQVLDFAEFIAQKNKSHKSVW
jgi:phage terminase Nu1 subunit (DNA packaging protein)